MSARPSFRPPWSRIVPGRLPLSPRRTRPTASLQARGEPPPPSWSWGPRRYARRTSAERPRTFHRSSSPPRRCPLAALNPHPRVHRPRVSPRRSPPSARLSAAGELEDARHGRRTEAPPPPRGRLLPVLHAERCFPPWSPRERMPSPETVFTATTRRCRSRKIPASSPGDHPRSGPGPAAAPEELLAE